MKPHYSEFIRHCLRFYIKTLDEGHGGHPIFKTDAERANWTACYQVLMSHPDSDIDIISQIYRPGDTIADKIYEVSKIKRIPQDSIWALINSVERKIAKQRGLV